MRKKKLISIMLIICVLLTVLITPTFAVEIDDSIIDQTVKLELDELKANKEYNLKSVKEQLEEQGRLDHYEIYEMLIKEEYEMRKKIVTQEISIQQSYYYAPNGGQVVYQMSPDGTIYTLAEDYFNKQQFDHIYNKHSAGELVTLDDFVEYVIAYFASIKFKKLGKFYAGYIGMTLWDTVVTNWQLNDIKNSSKGAGYNRSVQDSMDNSSTAWHIWHDYSFMPKPNYDIISLTIN